MPYASMSYTVSLADVLKDLFCQMPVGTEPLNKLFSSNL